MIRWKNIFGTGFLSAILSATSMSVLASTESTIENDLTKAILHGNCPAAVDLVNRGAGANDARIIFWGGRMLDEGVCATIDRAAAATFFERAAKLGDRDASLEFAAHVGLGEGSEQDYERAGQLCRTAGFDTPAQSSLYSLGYACTLSTSAARLARLNLAPHSLQTPTEAAKVDFRPASASLHILTTPRSNLEDAPRSGSHIRHPLVNVSDAIEEAWRGAAVTVPRPDGARLQDTVVELSIDLDLRLESIGGSGVEHKESDSDRLQFLANTMHQPAGSLAKH